MSELAEDNVTILCDGYWRREYFKPEAKRNWNHVAIKLDGATTASIFLKLRQFSMDRRS